MPAPPSQSPPTWAGGKQWGAESGRLVNSGASVDGSGGDAPKIDAEVIGVGNETELGGAAIVGSGPAASVSESETCSPSETETSARSSRCPAARATTRCGPGLTIAPLESSSVDNGLSSSVTVVTSAG